MKTIARLLLAAVLLWMPIDSMLAAPPTCTHTTNEQTVVQVTLTLCDGTGEQADECTDAGKTGALVTAGNWTQLRYWSTNHGTDCSMLSVTTVDPDDNPYAVTLPLAVQKIVGNCSATTDTCCSTDSDCPAGETCTLKQGDFTQYHRMTTEAQWTGSGQAVEEFIICVENMEDYP